MYFVFAAVLRRHWVSVLTLVCMADVVAYIMYYPAAAAWNVVFLSVYFMDDEFERAARGRRVVNWTSARRPFFLFSLMINLCLIGAPGVQHAANAFGVGTTCPAFRPAPDEIESTGFVVRYPLFAPALQVVLPPGSSVLLWLKHTGANLPWSSPSPPSLSDMEPFSLFAAPVDWLAGYASGSVWFGSWVDSVPGISVTVQKLEATTKDTAIITLKLTASPTAPWGTYGYSLTGSSCSIEMLLTVGYLPYWQSIVLPESVVIQPITFAIAEALAAFLTYMLIIRGRVVAPGKNPQN